MKLVHWKVLFFQVISVLAVIQYTYPTFKHNNFKANNVHVEKLNGSTHKFNYKIVSKKYTLPNIKYCIKMSNFEYSCIPGTIDNDIFSNELATNLNISTTQNRYYDLHCFFNSFLNLWNGTISDNMPVEVTEFINRIVPDKYKQDPYAENFRLVVNDEYILPHVVLESDIFFEGFRKQ